MIYKERVLRLCLATFCVKMNHLCFMILWLFIASLFCGCADKFSLDTFATEEKTRFFALMEQVSSARYALAKKADTKTQMTLLNQACEYRLGLACWIYAYEENGDKKAWNHSLERAALTLKNACLVMATKKPSIASGQSCAFLGIMLSQYPQMQVHIWELIGRNIQIQWLYQKACEMGEGWGCYRLGYDFLQKNDLQNALKMANEGLKMTALMCDRGVGYYCALSGVIYQYPLPNFVPSEEVRQEKMRYFWEKGCLKKDGDSCIYLSNLNNGEYKNAYYLNKDLPNKALQGSGFVPPKSKNIKSFSDELDYSKIIDSTKKASKGHKDNNQTKAESTKNANTQNKEQSKEKNEKTNKESSPKSKPKSTKSSPINEPSTNQTPQNRQNQALQNRQNQATKNKATQKQPTKQKPKIESIDIGSALDSSTLETKNPSSQNQTPQENPASQQDFVPQDFADFAEPNLSGTNLESLESVIK